MIALRGLVGLVFLAGVISGALAWAWKAGALELPTWWTRSFIIASLVVPLIWARLKRWTGFVLVLTVWVLAMMILARLLQAIL